MLHALVLAAVAASPSPAAASPALPITNSSGDATIDRIAAQQFVEWQTGNVDANAFLYTPKAQNVAQSHKVLSTYGDPISIAFMGTENEVPAVTVYLYSVKCTKGTVLEQFGVENGKLTSMEFDRSS